MATPPDSGLPGTDDRGSGAALALGRRALVRGAWHEALTALREAVATDPGNGGAWESLGNACMWLQDADSAIEARKRAYALYRERGDDASSARVCLDLVWDYLEVRGEPAVANGWFQRARRLLAELPPCPEHALLGVFDAFMTLDSDPGTAAAHAREAAALAEAVGAKDVGMLARALHGLALVTEGKVGDGMGLLDEAVLGAVGREITDPQWFYFTCCCMIDACDRVRDFDRSLAWCDQLRGFAERWGVQAFLTTCRIKYTGALLWRGDWARCEAELTEASAELAVTRPAAAAGALVRLAELRRRQGRLGEAEALLERAGPDPLALPVRAGLALDAGDAATAADLIDTHLRRIPDRARTERVAALEMKTRAHALLGNLAEARAAAAELGAIARMTGTPAVRAAALTAAGLEAAAAGEHHRARPLLEDAVHLFEGSGARPEAARARLDLAGSLEALGMPTRAIAEASAALEVMAALGAAGEARKAHTLLSRLGASPDPVRRSGRAGGAGNGRLTRRQQEVLALVAEGLSDREIADRLVLSEHTVHRHVANTMLRLGVNSRTAAVARALREDLL